LTPGVLLIRMPAHGARRFAEDTFTWEASTRRVFRRGSGPAVLVIHEFPGITPAVLAFADRVTDLGCTAVLYDGQLVFLDTEHAPVASVPPHRRGEGHGGCLGVEHDEE
jgi:dienelactone hydrolase